MSLLSKLVAKVDGERRRAIAKGELPVSSHEEEEHGENYISTKVISMDTQHEEVRGGAGLIHGSSLIGMCPRRQVLSVRANGAPARSVRSVDRLVWAIGRAVEKHIRTQFIAAVNFKGVLGEWRCHCGRSKISGFFSRTVKCETCKSSLDKFNELTLFDFEGNIVGNADMFYVRPDNQKVRTVEIKSKAKHLFDDLEAPEVDHAIQAFINRRLAQINDLEVDDYVTILYGCKDYAFKGSPYKEYYVRTTSHIETHLDRLWERAKLVKEAEADITILPERIEACTSKTSPTAKKCDMCEACFAV